MKPINKNIILKPSLLTFSIGLTLLSLTGCQSMPASSNKSLNAHDLMQQTMLHRFDRSYDYERTTHYQVASLYDTHDVESHDTSLFISIINLIGGGLKPSAERTVSEAQLACETRFTAAYNESVNQSQSKSANKSQVNAAIEKAVGEYDACLNALPEDKRLVSDSKIETTETTETTDEDSTAAPSDNFASISDIANAKKTDYKTTIKALTKTLNSLDKKNQQETQSEEAALLEKLLTDDEDGDIDSEEPDNRSISKLFKDLKITPQQIQVLNDSYLKPQTIRYKGSYHQPTGQFSTVLEEQYSSDYKDTYKRIPVLINMNEMSIIMEPDVALPLASILFKKELPQDLAGKSIKFVVPENIRQKIPLPVLKDTLIKAIGQAYGDIDAEKFNEIVVDDYGRSLHASRAVKINLTTNDMGFVVGRTLKYWSKELSQLKNTHPEYIQDNESFVATLELLAAANTLYRADDLAKLSQLIEAIIPLSYNSFNYYYFDSQNNLIGYRKISDYRSAMFNAKAKSITTNTIRYRNDNQVNHTFYYPQPADIVDGNQLVKKLWKEDKLKIEAQDARFGYSTVSYSEDDTLDVTDAANECAEEDIACYAAKAAQDVAAITTVTEVSQDSDENSQLDETMNNHDLADYPVPDTPSHTPPKKVDIATLGDKVE